ncbi:DUF5682 family protein [Chitinophaga caseinilytica]|uniref:DUF5682 family protein n=1 Tax=Chitinophaga caseinilytica TaxID=2267521 RepID=A0ABZ2Z9D9_9BACT
MSIHVLGIRHHGPGSAANVKSFLERLKPDIVLVEGPPEADALLQWADHEALRPPVAILAFQADDIRKSVFYPFATFSPEWQAIQYAKRSNIPVRFMDLPLVHAFAEDQQAENSVELENVVAEETGTLERKPHPMEEMAMAAGYASSDKWWEHTFEHRRMNDQVFDAIGEAMQAMRESQPSRSDREEQLREAYMRKIIRQAEKEMFTSIAVICGAWHAPALREMPPAKEDNELLKSLPKVKVECTWAPWSYNRLSYQSGYGAGIQSPGWYEHIWEHPGDDGSRWMTNVARLFRENNMDTSVAHVIEAVRLAESLAALRGLPKAGLEELNEATVSVLCTGENIMMQLINEQLIVSNKMGQVPSEVPKPPLQVDIEKYQKKLRIPVTPDPKDLLLDLRKEGDLEKSVFLHRLQLLGLTWAQKTEVGGKGTFKEQWRLQWDPAFTIEIIEKGIWGNTAAEAAARFVTGEARGSGSLRTVAALLSDTLPAELPEAVEALIGMLGNLSAASSDVMQLMEAIPSLVSVSRYGNVRKTDAALVTGIVTGMITRICISLPNACNAVSDEAAQTLLELLYRMNDSVNLLQQEIATAEWQQSLKTVSEGRQTAPVIAGYSTRLLADHQLLTGDALVKVFNFAMSKASAPATAAAWLEGFLKGSGTLLLLDANLWNVVNSWVATLGESDFTEVLPLLRRTFAHFTHPERRKLGEKVKQGGGAATVLPSGTTDEFDFDRGAKGLPVVMNLLGYK